MKRRAAVAVLCLLVPGLQAAEAPRLVVEPAGFDFGDVLQERTLTKEFRVSNVGSETLVIEKVSTTCGCTVAAGYDTTIAPGESTTMRVDLETRRSRGRIVRSVLVRSNAGDRPTEIRLEATVVARNATDE